MKCSIVAAVWNQVEYTRLFVETLVAGTDVPFELILVDNGSTDGTPQYLASLPFCRVIRNEQNRGAAYAWNQGITAATGTHICLCNNDIAFPKAWLGPLIQTIDSRPDLGIVCAAETGQVQRLPEQFGPESAFLNSIQVGCQPTLAELDSQYGGFYRFAADFMSKYRGHCLYDTGNCGCSVIRRDLIGDIGLFDVSFGLAFWEDCDFFLRTSMNKRFNRFATIGGSYYHHFGGRSVTRLEGDTALRSRERFFIKWPHVKADYERMGLL